MLIQRSRSDTLYVSWSARNGCWRARVSDERLNRRVSLGLFPSIAAAAQAVRHYFRRRPEGTADYRRNPVDTASGRTERPVAARPGPS